MALRLVQANVKARDDAALGRFWARALGRRVSSAGTGATSAAPEGFNGQGDVAWTVLADPEGNQFCVLSPG